MRQDYDVPQRLWLRVSWASAELLRHEMYCTCSAGSVPCSRPAKVPRVLTSLAEANSWRVAASGTTLQLHTASNTYSRQQPHYLTALEVPVRHLPDNPRERLELQYRNEHQHQDSASTHNTRSLLSSVLRKAAGRFAVGDST